MTLRLHAILKKRKDEALPFLKLSAVQEHPLEGERASPRPWRVVGGPVGHAAILDRGGHTVIHTTRKADAELTVARVNAGER